jgi:putative MFS transporter
VEPRTDPEEDRSYRPKWLRLTPFLGRAPALSRRQWRVLGLVSLVSLFEQYDLFLFSLALKQIQLDLAIPEAQLGLLGSVVRLGALPAILVTLAADRLGRRRILLFTIIAYTLLTGATAFSPNAEAFVLFQFLARVFGAAETLIAVVVIAEEFDAERRGWGIGALGAIQACGAGLAALVFSTVEYLPFGWRSLYLVGLGPLIVIAYLRRTLPETRRFERHRQRAGNEMRSTPPLQPLVALVRAYPARLGALACVWSPGVVGLLTFFGGAFAIVGNPLAGWLSDRRGRKPVGVVFTIALTLLCIAYYNAIGLLIPAIWIGMIFTLLGSEVTLAAYGAEMFPTSHRSTASGARSLVATLGGVTGLALVSFLYGLIGSTWVAISLLALCGFAVPLLLLLTFPETAGRSLEEIAPERTAR